LAPSKASGFAAALLEALSRTARAEIIPAELLTQFLGAMNDPHATLDLRFGREALPTFAHRLEKNGSSSKSCWSMTHRLSL